MFLRFLYSHFLILFQVLLESLKLRGAGNLTDAGLRGSREVVGNTGLDHDPTGFSIARLQSKLLVY